MMGVPTSPARSTTTVPRPASSPTKITTSLISTYAPSPASSDLIGLTNDAEFISESAWLDSLLSPATTSSLAALDSQLSSTLNLLDLVTADTSALVDRTIEEIARGVPRLSFDLGLLRENTIGLKFTLEGIRTRTNGTSDDKSANADGRSQNSIGGKSEVKQVMEKLRVLDLVKGRMEAARDVLREAESWSTLDSEVTALISDSSYSKAATRLAEAARSMVVFQHTVEYEARRSLMVSLQNQLEAALSASLVAAIGSRDVKGCKGYFAIFQQIEREAEFTAYYFGSRRSNLVSNWTRTRLIDCEEEEYIDEEGGDDELISSRPAPLSPVKLNDFLNRFYAEFHSLLNEERTYIPAIFPSPLPTFSSFIQTTLECLTPSLPSRLTAIQSHYKSTTLPELILAYKATTDFALLVDRIMVQLAESIPTATPTKLEHRLSSSHRMSVSKRRSSKSYSIGTAHALMMEGRTEDASRIVVRAWETALFEPFLDWQVEYPELERVFMDQEIAKIMSKTGEGDMMSHLVNGASERGARVLLDRTTAVFGLAGEAMGRNSAFTHGYASAETLRVIDGCIVDFMEARRNELDRARKGGARVQAPSGNRRGGEDELELEGLEYSTGDWGTFSFGLRLLEACRTISEKLVGLEVKLRTQLVVIAESVKQSRNDSTSRSSPAGSTTGAITMLRQSTLNSIDLARLLDPLEVVPPASTHLNLPKSRFAATDLTRATQLFLHSTILAPLLAHLSDYATLPMWSTPDAQARGKGAFDLSIPVFSLSPSDIMSKVGEGVFNLPRLFEVYANDVALGVSIETLPFVDTDSLKALLYPAPPLTPLISSSPRHLRRTSGDPDLASLSPSPSLTFPVLTIPTSPVQTTTLSAETVISTWLSSLTLSLLSHLTTKVLPAIPTLSKSGAAQLAADLGYISNVARALDVEAGEELDWWREATEIDEGGWRSRDADLGGKELWAKIGKMRGWRA